MNTNTQAAQAVAGLIFNTIATNTVEDAVKIANAINSPDSLAEVPEGTELHVCDIIASQGTRKGRNNMPDSPCINTVFILEDGTSVFTQSDGIARSVATFAALFPDCGRSQGLPYLRMIIEEKGLRNGNTLKVARLLV
ncbi:MAG: hypothetical protein IKD55_02245 [Sediminibacterium sp.]|nr:hypothetical protein [Sediminibacterium sp.]